MYESLLRRFKDQDPRTIFAHFGWRNEIGETWETPVQKLAVKAKAEDWDFHRPEFRALRRIEWVGGRMLWSSCVPNRS